MSIEQFYTREKANSGIKMPLYLPTGGKSEHWLMLRGVDSDAFRDAKTEGEREAAEIAAIKDAKERGEAMRASQRRLVSSLVSGWSFDQECTRESVENLFLNAPQIMDAVDKVVSNRAIFFAIGSASLNATPSNNLGSTKSHKARRAQSGKA